MSPFLKEYKITVLFRFIQLHSNFSSLHAVALQLSKCVVPIFAASTGISESQLNQGKVGLFCQKTAALAQLIFVIFIAITPIS